MPVNPIRISSHAKMRFDGRLSITHKSEFLTLTKAARSKGLYPHIKYFELQWVLQGQV